MPWAISNWKIFAAVALFFSGWYVHGLVYDSNKLAETEKKLQIANESTKKVIKFNEDWSKVNADKCANATIPDGYLRLLRK